jgi:type II secretory pathway pseudopilin PulG
MIVAVAILSLAALVVPSAMTGWQARTELRRSELLLDQLLNRAREEAIRGHRSVTLQFAPADARIGIPALGIWHAVPLQQTITVVGVGQGFRREAPAIVFLSGGHTTGGTITIEQGAAKVSRRIGWLSGRIEHGEK